MSRRRRLADGANDSGSKLGGCVGIGFFGIFGLAGLGMFVGLFVMPVLRIVDAQGWTETQCTITSSQVESHRGSDSTTYSVEVDYTYEVAGTSYSGDRYSWSTGSSSGYDGKREIVDSLPEGSSVTCYYDPDQPTDAVIRRGAGWFLLWGLFSVPFMAVGLGGLFFLWKAPAIRRKAEVLTEQARASRANAPPSQAVASDAGSSGGSGLAFRPPSGSTSTSRLTSSFAAQAADETFDESRPVWPEHPPQAPAGRLDLEPNVSRLGKFLGLTIFALLWNGLIGFGIWKVFGDELRTGEIDWLQIETLFFLPFVGVGLFLLLGMVHTFLSLFNPVPHLELGTGGPEVGTRFPLDWRLTGNHRRLKSFVVQLEGRESATYRRGTDTTTDHHTFYEEDLLEVKPVRTSRGATEVLLPAPSLPTWVSGNNKIEWRLRVKGDIPFWPDVAEDFPLHVAPPSQLGRRRHEAVPVRSGGDDPSVPGAVEIELDRGRFEPGEVVEGTVRWNTGGEPAESVLVSLLWHTQGKGTEDAETVAQTRIDAPTAQGEERFALQLAPQPWSFSGTLVSVVWLVEASIEPDGDLHRVDLTSAPGGEEVRV